MWRDRVRRELRSLSPPPPICITDDAASCASEPDSESEPGGGGRNSGGTTTIESGLSDTEDDNESVSSHTLYRSVRRRIAAGPTSNR